LTRAALRAGRLAEAGAHLRETVKLARHASWALSLIDALDEGAYLCAATGRCVEAVTLWSARAAQYDAAGVAADTPEEEHRRELPLREARQAVGSERFRAAQERGAVMTLDAAVEFAVMMTGENVGATGSFAGTRGAQRAGT
jgi:hypothetical protein